MNVNFREKQGLWLKLQPMIQECSYGLMTQGVVEENWYEIGIQCDDAQRRSQVIRALLSPTQKLE